MGTVGAGSSVNRPPDRTELWETRGEWFCTQAGSHWLTLEVDTGQPCAERFGRELCKPRLDLVLFQDSQGWGPKT